MLEVVHPRCGGLDVHKATVVACRLAAGPDGAATKAVRTFGTTTAELLEMADWLTDEWRQPRRHGVHRRLLEAHVEPPRRPRLTLLLVNAQHVKRVPGRKTDVEGREWIAARLQHGLLRAGFMPDRPQRELRDLTRQRSRCVGSGPRPSTGSTRCSRTRT